MFDRIKLFVRERNHALAMNLFSVEFGPESEFTERRVTELGRGMFKIHDPGTDHVMYFVHTIFGPMGDDI